MGCSACRVYTPDRIERRDVSGNGTGVLYGIYIGARSVPWSWLSESSRSILLQDIEFEPGDESFLLVRHSDSFFRTPRLDIFVRSRHSFTYSLDLRLNQRRPTELFTPINMITRKTHSLQSILTPTSFFICRRCLHHNVKAGHIPDPTPFVPNHTTFLTLIGRQLSKHASKFQSWKDLFTTSSPQLRQMGVEPARTRRYLLHWREKFRKGEFGIGGDLQHVQDGVGELRVIEVPTLKKNEDGQLTRTVDRSSANASITISPGMQKLILNVPAGATTYKLGNGQSTADLKKPAGVKLHRGHAIQGPHIQLKAGTNGAVGTLRVQEGLWEHRRGHKVDGGERRKAEVRFKMRLEQRKKERS